jgi:hypothetical protein
MYLYGLQIKGDSQKKKKFPSFLLTQTGLLLFPLDTVLCSVGGENMLFQTSGIDLEDNNVITQTTTI